MRLLPVYLLIDTSGSMAGEPIQAVNEGLKTLIQSLRRDPQALETVQISISTFNSVAVEVQPMQELATIVAPELTTPQSGATHLGDALELVLEKVSKLPKDFGWKPMLFVMTDGKPSDPAKFKEMAAKVKATSWGAIYGLAAGPKADATALELFCDEVKYLSNMSSAQFTECFKWVSDLIEAPVRGKSESLANDVSAELEAPPALISINLNGATK